MQWTLRGLITSQLGNVGSPLVQLADGGAVTPKEFIFHQVQYSVVLPQPRLLLPLDRAGAYTERGSQPHGGCTELCTVGEASEACPCWLQLSYESGWMAYDVVVLLAFCAVNLTCSSAPHQLALTSH